MLAFWAERADLRANKKSYYFSGHFLRLNQYTKDFTHIVPFTPHNKAECDSYFRTEKTDPQKG